MSSRAQKAKKNTRSSSSPSDKNGSYTLDPLRGTIVFIIFLIMSSFIGGAFKAFLSPKQIDFHIRQFLSSAAIGYKTDYTDVQFLLADGIYPKLGLRLNNIQFIPIENCKGEFGFKSGSVYLPLELKKLVKKEIGFGEIQISSLVVRQFSDTCSVSEMELKAAKSKRESDKSIFNVRIQNPDTQLIRNQFFESKQFVQTQFPKLVDQVRTRTSGVHASELILIVGDKPTPFNFQNLRIQFNKQDDIAQLIATAVLKNPGERLALDVNPLHFKVQAEGDVVELEMWSQYREGKLSLSSLFNYKNESIKSRMEFKSFPLQEIKKTVFGVRSLQSTSEQLVSWLNCSVVLEIDIEQIKSAYYQLENCDLTGDVGQMKFNRGEFSFIKAGDVNHLEVELSNVSIEKSLLLINRKPASNFLPSMGYLTGSLVVRANQTALLSSVVSKMHLLFQEGRRKEELRVSSAKLSANFDGHRWSAKVMDAQVEDGKLLGDMTLNISVDLDDGVFQFNFPEIRFSNAVNSLYNLKQNSVFELYGRGLLNDRMISHWSGALGSPKLETSTRSFEKIKLKGSYTILDGFNGVLSIDAVGISSSDKTFEDLRAILLIGDESGAQSIRFNDLSGQIHVNENSIAIDRLSAKVPQATATVNGKLSYLKNERRMSGSLIANVGAFRGAEWIIGTQKGGEFTILPSQSLIDKFDRMDSLGVQNVNVASEGEPNNEFASRWKKSIIKEPSPMKLLKRGN